MTNSERVRIANNKIAQYIANDEEINHNDLLKKTNVISLQNLDVTFLLINLQAKKEYYLQQNM